MKKILLIEHDKEVMRNTADILGLAEYEVVTAENGKKGIEIAFRENPDVIISDIDMPLLDGFGVLKLLQKHPSLNQKPVILLGAADAREEMRRAMQSGADDYIRKPFAGTELLEAIESRLKRTEHLVHPSDASGVREQREELPEAEIINRFLEGRNTDHYNRKQRIYEEGQRPHKLYYVKQGKVKLCKCSDEGKELVVDLLGPGDFLGHTALLEGSAYRESAETMEFTELLVIPRQDFEELINEYPVISRRFIKLLAKNIFDHEKKLVGLAYNSLRKKVADALLLLQRKYQPAPGSLFQVNIHRDDLAHIAGTATESLIRTLSDFRFERLIEIGDDGTITIINEKRLRNLFNR
ncbi:MAG TPA: response regulator [Chitinophagaceae bacterium]